MMEERTTTTTGKEFTGRHMLAIMVTFFGVIIAVNITMAWFAGRSWTGLVVKNSYVASQNFNGELQRAREQVARGWKSNLGYNDGRVTFQLTDRLGNPVILNDLKLTIGRPAFEQLDVIVTFTHTGNGSYEVARTLAPGIWAVRVEGGTGNRAYRRDDRLFVREGNE